MLMALAVALPVMAKAGDPEPVAPPFPSDGDLGYFIDSAGFRGREGRTDLELYVSISNDQLAYLEEDDAVWRGQLELEIVIRDPDGREVFRQESELSPEAARQLDAEDRAIVQVIRESASLVPGTYHLEAILTDRQSRKRGLLNRIRKARKKGEVVTWIEVGDFSEDSALVISEPVLLRNARRADPGTAFGRNGVDFDPNPSRYYGLVLPQVRCYAEVYGGSSWQEGDSFLVLSQLRDLSGEPVAEHRTRAVPPAPSFVLTEELPIGEALPGGSYELALTVMNERSRETTEVAREFEVIWAIDSWGREPERVLQEMILVMNDSEYKTLERLSPGAREVYLAEFWHEVDPDPETRENAVYEEFRRRIHVADYRYGSPDRRGILSDRGRVLVRYGDPDDIQYQFSSGGYGPDAGGQRVATPGERADLSGRPSTSFLDADEFREGDVSDIANQRGSSTIESKALEIWRYDGRGSALRGRVDLQSDSHRGLKFIFADEMGNGEFQLIGSSGAIVY
jgi:GWxTD domain-containing protein